MRRAHRLAPGRTGAFEGYRIDAEGLTQGRRGYWRATVRRAGTTAVGPVRSFPVMPPAGDPRPLRLVVASCACQFLPYLDDLIALKPDAFVWMGDLNYPDTVGPLAQTMTGYAGIWRDFLANPLIGSTASRAPRRADAR